MEARSPGTRFLRLPASRLQHRASKVHLGQIGSAVATARARALTDGWAPPFTALWLFSAQGCEHLWPSAVIYILLTSGWQLQLRASWTTALGRNLKTGVGFLAAVEANISGAIFKWKSGPSFPRNCLGCLTPGNFGMFEPLDGAIQCCLRTIVCKANRKAGFLTANKN